jgi:hypothetical protein
LKPEHVVSPQETFAKPYNPCYPEKAYQRCKDSIRLTISETKGTLFA